MMPAWAEMTCGLFVYIVIYLLACVVISGRKGRTGSWTSAPGHPQYIAGMRDYPDIIEIIKEPGEQYNWGGQWHADLTCLEKPPMGSILYAHEVPAWGGDTLFANMYLAYESLSGGMRSLLDSLVAVHESGEPRLYSDGYLSMHGRQNDGACGTEHPVVRSHPETGRKALYVNRDYTRRFKDMTAEESAPLIKFLFEHAARPEFTCRFRWRQHSVAFWDNRCVHHLRSATTTRGPYPPVGDVICTA